MSEELRRCPFCGGKVGLEHDEFGTWIRCVNPCCAIVGLTMITECWQKRPIEDTLRQEINEIQHGYEIMRVDNDTLRKQLEVAKTDLQDTTAQLVMDEEIEKELQRKLDIAVRALKQYDHPDEDEYNWRIAHDAIAEIEKVGGNR